MTDASPTISERRLSILDRIEKAARESGRNPDDITLVAVSKKQPDERIDAMLSTGQRVFGENRVQEALTRWTPRRDDHPDLELRLIGPLQTNKSLDAVSFFDVIETLDRPKLARHLADAMAKTGKTPQLLVQVNTGEESQKAGITPADADRFIEEVRSEFDLHPVGVMCIPPQSEPAGPHFALLKKIADRNGLDVVSAGMSSDFETAIRFGSTHVRIGSAMFGERPTEPG